MHMCSIKPQVSSSFISKVADPHPLGYPAPPLEADTGLVGINNIFKQI